MKRLSTVVAVGAVAVLAACGSSGSSTKGVKSTNSSAPSTSSSSGGAAASATVVVASSRLGQILVDSSGKTLYLLTKDTATNATCTAACTQLWPALTVTGTPSAGTGIDTSKLTTINDANGTQVVYGGHPLYRFSGDTAAGQTNGQGFANGIWWTISPDGQPVTTPM